MRQGRGLAGLLMPPGGRDVRFPLCHWCCQAYEFFWCTGSVLLACGESSVASKRAVARVPHTDSGRVAQWRGLCSRRSGGGGWPVSPPCQPSSPCAACTPCPSRQCEHSNTPPSANGRYIASRCCPSCHWSRYLCSVGKHDEAAQVIRKAGAVNKRVRLPAAVLCSAHVSRCDSASRTCVFVHVPVLAAVPFGVHATPCVGQRDEAVCSRASPLHVPAVAGLVLLWGGILRGTCFTARFLLLHQHTMTDISITPVFHHRVPPPSSYLADCSVHTRPVHA